MGCIPSVLDLSGQDKVAQCSSSGAVDTKAMAGLPGGGESGMTRRPRGSVVVTLCLWEVRCAYAVCVTVAVLRCGSFNPFCGVFVMWLNAAVMKMT